MKIQNHCLAIGFVTLFLSINYAQDSNWSLGVSFSPDLCYRWQPNEQTSVMEFVLKDKLTPKFGCHTGITTQYALNERFTLQADLRYARMGLKTKQEPCEGPPYDTTSMCSRHYNYSFIELPLGINYSLGSGKMRITVGAFISPGVILKYTRIMKITPVSGDPYRDAEIVSPENIFSLAAGLRAGLSYRINERVTLMVQPEYKLGLKREFYSSHLWSAGINVYVLLAL